MCRYHSMRNNFNLSVRQRTMEASNKFSSNFCRFHWFQELVQLRLDDNRITTIEKRAFMNLDKLKYLTLRGNKVNMLSDEAFQVFIFSAFCDCDSDTKCNHFFDNI